MRKSNIVSEQRLEVLSIGETLIDLISDTEQGSLGEARSFRMYPGGQATNVALNLARLGASAILVARVGDDPFGSYLRQHLEIAGVGTAYIHTTPQKPTTLVVVTRQSRICPYVNLTKPSLDDCIRLFGADQTPETYATHFLAWGARQVVLTMGADGVLLANAEGTSYYSTHLVEVVDVTGAGDSFWAGLLVATLDGYTMPEAIRVAQAVAAIKLQQIGPLSQVIDRAALYAHIGLQKEES